MTITKRPFLYKEAFCLMQYSTKDGAYTETIWNSRDGITPFITLATGTRLALSHTNWPQDIFNPLHVPRIGDRIFVDATLEECRQDRLQWAVKSNDPQAVDQVDVLAWADYVHFYPCTPRCIVVDACAHYFYKKRAQALRDHNSLFGQMLRPLYGRTVQEIGELERSLEQHLVGNDGAIPPEVTETYRRVRAEEKAEQQRRIAEMQLRLPQEHDYLE